MRLSCLILLLVSLPCFPVRAQEETELTSDLAAEETATAGEEISAEEENGAEPTTPAEESAAEVTVAPDDSDATAAESLVETLKTRFSAVAELLAQVQDAETAQSLQGEVGERFAALLQTDTSTLESENEEELAAEFAEAFAPIDAELARLEEENFYGVESLRAIFAESEDGGETEEATFCFPLGPLDFLRGGEKRQVCPRKEGGLQLMDWDEE